jgi:hypothetical protein
MDVLTIAIAKLEIEPGDILLVQTEEKMTYAAHERIEDAFKAAMDRAGVHAPILIGDKSVTVSVMKAPPAELSAT